MPTVQKKSAQKVAQIWEITHGWEAHIFRGWTIIISLHWNIIDRPVTSFHYLYTGRLEQLSNLIVKFLYVVGDRNTQLIKAKWQTFFGVFNNNWDIYMMSYSKTQGPSCKKEWEYCINPRRVKNKVKAGYMPVIPALGRQRQAWFCKFKVSLVYWARIRQPKVHKKSLSHKTKTKANKETKQIKAKQNIKSINKNKSQQIQTMSSLYWKDYTHELSSCILYLPAQNLKRKQIHFLAWIIEALLSFQPHLRSFWQLMISTRRNEALLLFC